MTRARARAALVTLTLMIVTTLVGLAPGAEAHHSAQRIPRYYHASLTPGPVGAGTTATFTFRITSGEATKGLIGSADIFVPSGFAITAVSSVATFNSDDTPAGKTWTAGLDGTGTTIELRDPGPGATQKLDPGQYIEVTFDATAPCVADTYRWMSHARATADYSNNGKNFVIPKRDDPGDPRVSVSGTC